MSKALVKYSVSIVSVALAVTIATVSRAETVQCQRTIVKESSKFLKTEIKALQKCEDKKVQGKLAPATECNAVPEIEIKIEKATSKLRGKIGKSCGGADGVCGGDTTGEDGAQATLGWPATCPNLEDNPAPECMLAIGASDCTGVADCLKCNAGSNGEEVVALAYSMLNPSDPATDKPLNQCQRTLGKEAAKFVLAKAKVLRSCWDRRLKGLHGDDCPDATGAAKITSAQSKMEAKMCKACGGPDQLCDGVDDFSAAVIGFEPDCPDVVIPFGGPSCQQDPVTTLDELVTCLACVDEYRVDCVDRVQVPEFGALPGECTPVMP